MKERESTERCANCPFNFLPETDGKIWEVIDLFQELSTPIGLQSMDTLITAYRPHITNLEYIEIVKALNEVHVAFNQQMSTKYENIKAERMN